MIYKVVIIEDEELAAARIKRLLSELEDTFEVQAVLQSVAEACSWFSKPEHQNIDLILSDIQLTDGISFEIFEKIKLAKPIIFTTAYDQYLMQAFKNYGIEYLLKPFSKEDLALAIQKYKDLGFSPAQSTNLLDFFSKQNIFTPNFPTFISYNREQMFPLKSEDIAFFYLENQMVYAYYHRKYWLNDSLNQVQEKLPEYHFFRANRQCIIQRKFIAMVENHLGGRLKVKLTINTQEEILISKENAKAFKDWLQS